MRLFFWDTFSLVQSFVTATELHRWRQPPLVPIALLNNSYHAFAFFILEYLQFGELSVVMNRFIDSWLHCGIMVCMIHESIIVLQQTKKCNSILHCNWIGTGF
ncbi:hypothetical protein ACOSP7_001934 [Xanthoceras sorbifolium]